jgi:hypothetical protein
MSNARTSLQDTQAGAVITNVGAAQAEPAITLLNEAGISTVALGDEALKRVACSSRSDIYPNGHETAIVVTDAAPMSLAFRAHFLARLGFTPTDAAWSSYQGASAVLTSLGSADVKTDDSPPRLTAMCSRRSSCGRTATAPKRRRSLCRTAVVCGPSSLKPIQIVWLDALASRYVVTTLTDGRASSLGPLTDRRG